TTRKGLVGACWFVILHDGAPLAQVAEDRLPAVPVRSLLAACDAGVSAP
ncbi:MAG: hypothetical protein QOC92_2458, partial [Acidimicrobiaceae bacterium]